MTSTEIDSLAEALIDANDALLGVFDLTDVTATSLDDGDVVPLILERAMRVVRAEALTLSTETASFGVGSRETRSALLSGRWEASSTTVSAVHSGGLEGDLRAARTGDAFSIRDRRLLLVALRTALSSIEMARLHRETVETAIAAREQEQAAEIAQLALPKDQPTVAGVDVFFQTEQVRSTGGDLVCFHIDGDTLHFAVGDVSGKGLPAAVIMTTAVCAIHAAFRDPRSQTPGRQLDQVNEWVFDHLTDAGLFLTLFVGQVSSTDRSLRWANAGHGPCLVSRATGPFELTATTPPLGVTRPLDEATATTEFGSSDILFVGSDGVVEQSRGDGEMFGEPRLLATLAEHHTASHARSARAIGAHLREALDAFCRPSQQQDDRTVVVLRREIGTRR